MSLASDSLMQSMTGMPAGVRRPVRRSGGRHAAAAPTKPKPKSSPSTHHDALNTAMAKGNHAAAKSSALMLAKALHLQMARRQKPETPSDGDDGMTTNSTPAPDAALGF